MKGDTGICFSEAGEWLRQARERWGWDFQVEQTKKRVCVFLSCQQLFPFLKRGVNNNNQTFFSHFWEERSQRYKANTKRACTRVFCPWGLGIGVIWSQLMASWNHPSQTLAPTGVRLFVAKKSKQQRPRACWVSAALSGDDGRSDNFLGSGNIYIPHQTQYVWDIMLSIWWAY